MKRVFLLIILLALKLVCFSQSAFYGAIFVNSIDSAFLEKVINMEKQKDSEIINVIYFSNNERIQLNYLQNFLRNPFTQNISTIDYNIVQSAFDKYYQSSKIQLLYDLDISAQPTKVLAFSPQQFKTYTPVAQYEVNFSNTPFTYYNVIPCRKEKTIEYMNAFKEAARTIGELSIFYPETVKKLKILNQEQFPDFGNVLKQVFTDDLKNVFENVYNYIDNYPQNAVPDIETSFIKERNISIIRNSDVYLPYKITVETIDKATNGFNPVNLFNYFDKKYYSSLILTPGQKTAKDKIGIALHGLNLIQTALRDTSAAYMRKANLWITPEQLIALNKNEFRYFVGLIYQKDIHYFNYLFNFDEATPENSIIDALEPYINSVLDQLTYLQDFINHNPVKDKNGSYTKFLNLYYNVIANNPFLTNDLKQHFKFSKDVIYLYNNCYNRTYATSVYYIIKVLNDLQQNKPELNREMTIVDNYGNFLCDIINCNNSEQLNEVICKYVPKK